MTSDQEFALSLALDRTIWSKLQQEMMQNYINCVF